MRRTAATAAGHLVRDVEVYGDTARGLRVLAIIRVGGDDLAPVALGQGATLDGDEDLRHPTVIALLLRRGEHQGEALRGLRVEAEVRRPVVAHREAEGEARRGHRAVFRDHDLLIQLCHTARERRREPARGPLDGPLVGVERHRRVPHQYGKRQQARALQTERLTEPL